MIDVQNDFCPGGALAVTDGDAVVEPINRLAAGSPFVVATRDWHPADHGSFADSGGPWPVHCVQDTEGAALHPGVDSGQVDVIVDKGQARDLEGYSGFGCANAMWTPSTSPDSRWTTASRRPLWTPSARVST